MRLGMALDTLQKGGDGMAAMERITGHHFNYGEVSNMDRKMRRLIPWTFMSRNLPLQIESMWTKPRAYAQYQSLVRNFSEDPDPDTPDYWLAQGAFNTGLELAGLISTPPPTCRTPASWRTQALGQGRPEKLLSHINLAVPGAGRVLRRPTRKGSTRAAPIEPTAFEPLESVPMAVVPSPSLMMFLSGRPPEGTSGKPRRSARGEPGRARPPLFFFFFFPTWPGSRARARARARPPPPPSPQERALPLKQRQRREDPPARFGREMETSGPRWRKALILQPSPDLDEGADPRGRAHAEASPGTSRTADVICWLPAKET